MKIRTIAALSFLAMGSMPSLAAGNGPAGEWLVEDRTAVVRISKCGSGYCGFVAKGQAGKDYRNPDPAKRNRSVIGIEVMFNMKGGPTSWSGPTYNAEDGQLYDGKITVTGPTTLQVEGCVPGGGVCGSQNWTRAR